MVNETDRDISVPRNTQMYGVTRSGQLIALITSLSGELSVDVTIGDVIAIISGNIYIYSGEIHVISGSVTLGSGGQRIGTVGVTSGLVSIQSGLVSVQSGEAHILSGSVTLGSGAEGIGHVGINSGQVSVQSGLVGVTSGRVDILSGEIHVLSGQLIGKISGEATKTAIYLPVLDSGAPTISSGGVGWLLTDNYGRLLGVSIASGEVHVVSGQLIAKVSGETVSVASGAVVNRELLSGLQIIVGSGVGVLISGQTVVIASGAIIDRALLSGLQVITQSGLGTLISGQTVNIASGAVIDRILLSGLQTIPQSGVGVTVNSGLNVILRSGTAIILESGTKVKVSGEVLKAQSPSAILAGYTQVTTGSGGIQLASGSVVHVHLRNISTSGEAYVSGGMVWVGPPGILSGTGYLLKPSSERNYDIDNLNKVYVIGEVSGTWVTWDAEVE